uniref:V-type proton ATPase subunit H n=1 Tax=Gouania willdenowi TaxID=441366 RepID=A0A8C5IBK4_GOUWI
MDIRGAVDAAVPTNIIDAKAAEVRSNLVNWQSYLQSQMISAEDCEFIKKFEVANSEDKQLILTREGNQCAKTFLNLMAHISKEQTVQYILTLIDDTLQENPQRVSIFFDYAKKTKNTAWSYFLPMLNRQDFFTVHMAARIIAKLAAMGRDLMEGSDLNYYFNWIKSQLSSQVHHTESLHFNNNFTSNLVSSFFFFFFFFGPFLCDVFSSAVIVPVVTPLHCPFSPYLLGLLFQSLFTFLQLSKRKNFLEKSTERETRQEYALAMIQCKVLKQLENLDQQKYDDEDITEDIKFLLERLGESVQDLSSFDEYSSELKSGRLEWSPVHKSEKFWRENAVRLNEKNYELLKILTRLLEVSDDPQVIAVAAHDVGEYVRHFPRGKRVIEQLGGKQLVMNHMHHEDQLVRYNALLAVQKLMVHNWEYLGRQLQSSDQQQA